MSGQFGKNHLGDRNEHLPTVHGFDEFFGNLYHLNTEETFEQFDYPKDPEFRQKFGTRGVLHCYANTTDDETNDPRFGKMGKQKCKDTGELSRKRMETVDDADSGGKRTDYNFQFAKRFWNNRFRIVVGGKVSTGSTVQQDETFIDNVSIEYRLDNSGTRYVKLFHDKNYESVLEGEIIETGVGIVLRKKMSHLGELFIFKSKKKK